MGVINQPLNLVGRSSNQTTMWAVSSSRWEYRYPELRTAPFQPLDRRCKSVSIDGGEGCKLVLKVVSTVSDGVYMFNMANPCLLPKPWGKKTYWSWLVCLKYHEGCSLFLFL